MVKNIEKKCILYSSRKCSCNAEDIRKIAVEKIVSIQNKSLILPNADNAINF